MRKWHFETKAAAASVFKSPHRRKAKETETKVDDAELILTPVYTVNRRRCLSAEKVADANGHTPIPLSKRFASFGTPQFIGEGDQAQRPNNFYDVEEKSAPEPQFQEEVTIPLNDIIRVTTRGEDGGKKPKSGKKRSTSTSSKEECRQPAITITTCTSESYELLMESTNEQLVLLTFLKVNSAKGKVSFAAESDDEGDCKIDSPQNETSKNIDSGKTRNIVYESSSPKGVTDDYQPMIESNPSNLTQNTSASQKSFDVEALTSKKMTERLKTESLLEKLERRVYRLFTSLEDVSSSFTKCACGCLGETTLDNAIVIDKTNSPHRRRNTASTIDLSENDKLEVNPSSSSKVEPNTDAAEPPIAGYTMAKQPTRDEMLLYSQLPSGLSVEVDDDPVVDMVPSDTLMRSSRHAVPVLASDI